MNPKLIKFGLLTFGLLLIFMIVQFSTFDIFETSDKDELRYLCDYEGLRHAEVYRLTGNSVTNPSIHVEVDQTCGKDYKNEKKGTRIFSADSGSIGPNDVKIDWITFDTLEIEYKEGLRIFTQLKSVEYEDPTLNIFVKYKKLD